MRHARLHRVILGSVLILSSPGYVQADVPTALAEIEAGQPDIALRELEPLAIQGDPQARYLLGRMYARGEGILKHYSLAHTWLTLAANDGVADALFEKSNIGDRLSTRDIIESMKRQQAIRDGRFKGDPRIAPPQEEADGDQVAMAQGDGAAAANPADKNGQRPETQQAAVPRGEDDIVAMSRNDLVREIQTRLNDLGYDAGAPDGLFGRSTRSAITAFQKDRSLDQTGEATPDLLRQLRQGKPA